MPGRWPWLTGCPIYAMIKRLLFSLGLLALLAPAAQAQAPTDNPYRTFYGNVLTHWTDSLPWNRVFDITNYSGQTMVMRYTAARDAAVAAGGGVVYFPAGTYNFEDNIFFAPNVIIRGETPVQPVAKQADFAPPTRFVFPEYIPTFTGNGTPNSTAFKRIAVNQAGVSNTGIVYVDVNHARISISGQGTRTVMTPKGSTNWSTDNNRNGLIFGVRQNNAASPSSAVPDTGQLGWQRHVEVSSTNISMYIRNPVLANCRLNDFENNTVHPVANASYFQPGYKAYRRVGSNRVYSPVDSAVMAPFDYTNHTAISVNRKAAVTFAEPEDEPDLFRPGVEIRDNWIYHTMWKGVTIAGLGLIADGNEMYDKRGKKVYLQVDGREFHRNNAATFENRGIDYSGWNVTITRNKLEVRRHTFPSGYGSVDGEGILLQECCGGTSAMGALIRHNDMTGGGYIGLWKTRDIHNVTIDSNNLAGNEIFALANTNGANNSLTPYGLSNLRIADNYNVSSIDVDGNKGGTSSIIINNTGLGTGTLRYPCHVASVNNVGFTERPCTPDSVAVFPEVTLANPGADALYLTNVPATIQLDAVMTSGTADSLYFYEGTRIIARQGGANSSFTWAVPPGNGVYFLTVRARDAQRNFAWAPVRKIQVCRDCDYTGVVNGVKGGRPSTRFQVWPNPAASSLNLPASMQAQALQVTDLAGRVLISQSQPGQQVAVGSLPAGLYQVRVKTATGIMTAQFIKQ